MTSIFPTIAEEQLPDFTEYGFHTGKKLKVIRSNGEIEVTYYHGYGLFGPFGGHERLYEDVVSWVPYEE